MTADQVHIQKLSINAIVGPDSWNQPSPQACRVTLDMATDFSRSSRTDDLQYSLNYAVISRDVARFLQPQKNYQSMGQLARQLSDHVVAKHPGIDRLVLKVESATAHIRSDDVSAVVYTNFPDAQDRVVVSNLKLLTLIGVFTFERLQKQFVTLELGLPWPKTLAGHVPYREVIDDVVAYVESSNFKTVEALVESVAQVVTQNPYFAAVPDMAVDVKVIKLNAITATEGVGVSCARPASHFSSQPRLAARPCQKGTSFDLPVAQQPEAQRTAWNTAVLAFGSNVGDRFSNIQQALAVLETHPQVRLAAVSSLFESEPMYFKDQQPFMNGCVEVSTQLTPHELLQLCKTIEYEELGRVKHFDNGPRSIDLDIVLYRNALGEHVLLTTEDLVVPHPRMLERSFVLEPLCELVPHAEVHPITAEPIHQHLAQLYERGNDEDVLWRLVPVPKRTGCDGAGDADGVAFLRFKNKLVFDDASGAAVMRTVSPTYVMGILNTTPDSFSDGSKHYADVQTQLQRVRKMVDDALELHDTVLLDVGGCSTRPNSEQAPVDEELRRAIPVISAIRACKDIPQDRVLISIDTYRSEVARQAISAGADIVNDVSGGLFDPQMFEVVAANPSVAYVMSHTRGDISTMTALNKYAEDIDGASDAGAADEHIYGRRNTRARTRLVRGIGRELAAQYVKAMEHGVRRWQLILDPGIGFAKNSDQNLDVIGHCPLLKHYSCTRNGRFVNFRNVPVLLGPSRKRFIGKITGDEVASSRDFATGSLVSSCVGFGADIVRVHDVKNCSKSVKLADALYRQQTRD